MAYRISNVQMFKLSHFEECARIAEAAAVRVELKYRELNFLLDLLKEQHEALVAAGVGYNNLYEFRFTPGSDDHKDTQSILNKIDPVIEKFREFEHGPSNG